jgi:hypothetical protein
MNERANNPAAGFAEVPFDAAAELALALYPVADVAIEPAKRVQSMMDHGFHPDMMQDHRCRALFRAIEARVSAGKITDLTHAAEMTDIAFVEIQRAADSIFDHQLPGRIAELRERDRARRIGRIINQAAGMDPDTAVEFMLQAIAELDGGTVASINPVTATSYVDNLPPVYDPVLVDLFDAGDKCWLIGSSKARKSFFALQLSISIATGRPFMRWQTHRARRVLLIQLEIKSTHFHRRVNHMARAMRVSEIDNLCIVNGRGAGIDMASIKRLAVKCAAEVVIIDPLYKLLQGDENSAEVMGAVMRQVDHIAEATGAAVLIVHHERKGHAGDRQAVDRGAGSGTLARDYDAAVYIAAHATEADTVVVSSIARNYAPQDPFTAVWSDGCFTESEAAPIEATSATMRKQAGRRPAVSDLQVVQLIETDGPFTTERLTQRLQDAGCTRDLAKETPRRLIAEGVLADYRERRFHGCRWIGTPGQIQRKKAQSDQTDSNEQIVGLRAVCKNGGFSNV